jgi:hypothetical protein
MPHISTPDVTFTSYTDDDGTTWGRLLDSTWSCKAISCADNNIYLSHRAHGHFAAR